jgi:hypothetical protein
MERAPGGVDVLHNCPKGVVQEQKSDRKRRYGRDRENVVIVSATVSRYDFDKNFDTILP